MSQFYADGMTIRRSFHVYNVRAASQNYFLLCFTYHHFLGYIITAIFDRCRAILDQTFESIIFYYGAE